MRWCVRIAERWNHNIHYQPVIVRAVPAGSRSALDVGCGEGLLVRDLRRVVDRVIGIDLDPPSISLSRQQDPQHADDYVVGDFLTHPFELESFDVVTSIAALHHVDAAEGLQRMAALLRPGGTLALIGCARSELPRDLGYEAAAFAANLPYKMTRHYWQHSAPTVWPPPETYASMRAIASRVLPGGRFRRRLLWRYSLTWTRPQDTVKIARMPLA